MTNNNDMLLQVWKMLRSTLRGGGHLHLIDGYVCGRTANDDPYIILYPAGEHMEHKAVRVYNEQLKRLPDFIPTDNIEDDANGGNPTKEQAKRKGYYHECQRFEVLTYDGKDTQMGKEKRFGDVLRVLPPRTSPPPPQASPTPASSTPPRRTQESPPRREPSTPPTSGGRGDAPATKKEQADAHYRKEARTSSNRFLMITAFGKLYPEVATESIAKSVEHFCGYFTPPLVDDTEGFTKGAEMLAAAVGRYWEVMTDGGTHAAAKEEGANELYRG